MSYPTIPDRPPDSLPFDVSGIVPLPPKWSALAADAPPSDVWKELDAKGVKVGCASTACDRDLHCFRLTKKMAKLLPPGSCRECHVTFVSISRTGKRDLVDVDYTFAAMQREMIRHRFWHVPFGEKALRDAIRRGPGGLRERVPVVLRARIGAAQPYRDGRQTPMDSARATATDLAMHAVAACCRRCVQYWHGIPLGVELKDEEIAYLSSLALRFLEARLTGLDGWASPQTAPDAEAQIHNLLRPPTILGLSGTTLKAS